MGERKLTKAQEEALSIVNEVGRLPGWGAKRGVPGSSLWALERRDLLTWGRDANGVYFEITDAGRSALEASK